MPPRTPRLAVVLGALLGPVFMAAQQAGPASKPGSIRTDAKLGPEYVWVARGTFPMGCVPADNDCTTDELPRHRVTLSQGFWMGRTEVTLKAFQQFAKKTRAQMPPEPRHTPFRTLSGKSQEVSAGFRPGPGKKEDRPVVNVSWKEARAFCEFAGGRLPTEAEWEYAARGGQEGSIYPHGSALSHDDANYGNVGGQDLWSYAAPAGSFPANGFGLHDMAGNVWEWTADWLDEDYYRQSPETDPQGPEHGIARAARGGSWGFGPKYLRISVRVRAEPDGRAEDIGFRCVVDHMN